MEELREKVKNLPLLPGVYIMMDRHGEVIYVGKAKSLKNRVSQYFQENAAHSSKTRSMVSQVEDFDIIVAASEFEALVLECSLIKRHMPKYNIKLKDDKGYPFIRLSNEKYPRFTLANKRLNDGAKYFGPYGTRVSTRAALEAILKALKLPACSKKFPADIGRERPCLNMSIGRCAGWCRPELSREDYLKDISQAVRILEGKTGEVTIELERMMLEASDGLSFERAAEFRDRIKAIEILKKKQKALASSMSDTDAVGFFRGDVRCCFTVLHYIDGALLDKDSVVLSQVVEEDEAEILSSFLKQYYVPKNVLPKRILLPFDIEDREELGRLLSENNASAVSVTVPKKGDTVSFVRLACLNAGEEAERVTTGQERMNKLITQLQKTLSLEKPPCRIEAYDISSTVRGEMVGAMTVFVDGKPYKSGYRSYIIKSEGIRDDYGAMKEMLSRRFERYLSGDKGFELLPDLLLIDGGSAHAAAALSVLRELGIEAPVFGMVKDERHRTRAIAVPGGGEIGIKGSQALFAFIGSIQEETHNRAIEFHRKRRLQQSRSSGLDKIPGVGPKRKSELLRHFGSIAKIKEATLEELLSAVPKNTAAAVFEYYHDNHGKDTGQ